ncbi:MAG: GNAT family acetyltransferase [Lachnospiraceae bacterium]|nr:GNAT family acetyltransferase [Lachnospiraceae bacterium]
MEQKDKEQMSNYTVMNILDLVESVGEDEIQKGLSSFSCPLNMEIEDFIHRNAIEFAKRKLSITYLLLDNVDGEIVGFFTLTHKAIEIKNDNISNTTRRKLSAHARLDADTNSFTASAFLLAQIGKNYSVDNGKRIRGSELIRYANDIMTDIQHRIGGGIIYLDCEDKPYLKNFYIDQNHYKIFGERNSNSDGIRYLQMIRFF